jgi:hypothetical protein
MSQRSDGGYAGGEFERKGGYPSPATPVSRLPKVPAGPAPGVPQDDTPAAPDTPAPPDTPAATDTAAPPEPVSGSPESADAPLA